MKTKWYALFKSLEIKEYFNKEDSLLRSNFLVIEDSFRGTINPGNGFDWPSSNYSFYDLHGNVIKPDDKGWKLMDIDETYISSNKHEANLIFADPNNVIRRIKYSNKIIRKFDDKNDLVVVVEGIKKLHAFSRFANWEEYDLKLENESLKSDIQNLRAKIDILEKEASKPKA